MSTTTPPHPAVRLNAAPMALARFLKQSVVVHEDGSPKVVYHGSRAPWMDQFDLRTEGSGVVHNNSARTLGGIWFTSSRTNAEWFADQREKVLADPASMQLYGIPGTYYAAIDDISGTSLFQVGPYPTREEAQQAGDDNVTYYNQQIHIDTFVLSCYLRLEHPLRLTGIIPREHEFRQARARRRDGIIATNVTDGVEHGNLFVVFHPRQIKSGTDNCGTYDPTTASIRA